MSERIPLLFAPGFRGGYYVNWHPKYTGSHSRVMSVFNDAGFAPYFFQPDWRNSKPQEWATDMAQCASEVAKQNGGKIAMAGFSCGGLVAVLGTRKLLDADEVRVAGLFAGSIPLWFGEFGVRRDLMDLGSGLHGASEELKSNLCELDLPEIDCPIKLIVGTYEVLTNQDAFAYALAAWPQAEGITPPSGHNLFEESYLNAIRHNVGSLAVCH